MSPEGNVMLPTSLHVFPCGVIPHTAHNGMSVGLAQNLKLGWKHAGVLPFVHQSWTTMWPLWSQPRCAV